MLNVRYENGHHRCVAGNPSQQTETPCGNSATAMPTLLPFNRRNTMRSRVEGWAQVVCSDPLRTFLGGTVELVDVSDAGVGFITDSQLHEGDLIEVRMPPFRCRGRFGRVIRCVETEDSCDSPTPRKPSSDMALRVTNLENAETSRTDEAVVGKTYTAKNGRRFSVGIVYSDRIAAA